MNKEKETTEEKATEGKIDEADSLKLAKLERLMRKCIKRSESIVDIAFPVAHADKRAEMACQVATALFHKAAAPDQTEAVLDALERGLEWYTEREEKQKAESAKIEDTFKTAIEDIIPPRTRSGLETLVFDLLNFVSRSAAEQFEKENKRDDDTKGATER